MGKVKEIIFKPAAIYQKDNDSFPENESNSTLDHFVKLVENRDLSIRAQL